MCVVSNCLKYDTITVHKFQQPVIQYLKVKLPEFSKLLYFSDGAASQYINLKYFCNLTFHSEDFDVDAEWHFFATSHGKNFLPVMGLKEQ